MISEKGWSRQLLLLSIVGTVSIASLWDPARHSTSQCTFIEATSEQLSREQVGNRIDAIEWTNVIAAAPKWFFDFSCGMFIMINHSLQIFHVIIPASGDVF